MADHLLVYDPARQMVTALNASALAVWELCDGTRTAAQVVDVLRGRLGAAPPTLADDVARTIEALVARGVLEEEFEDAVPALQTLDTFVTFDGTPVAVHSNSAPLVEAIRHRFQHMSSGRVSPIARCQAMFRDGRWDVFSDPELVQHEQVVESAARAVEREVLTAWIAARPDLVWLHAGAVAWGSRALLVVGAAGQGKSTLTTEFVERGWAYLSDEAVAIDPIGAAAHPLPLSPRVRPELPAGATPGPLEDAQRHEIAVPADRVCRRPLPVTAVLFPQFSLEGPESIEACAPAETALRLLENCQTFSRGSEVAMRLAVDLARRLPAYRLVYRRRATAVDLTLGQLVPLLDAV